MPDDDPGLMTIFAEALERTDPADAGRLPGRRLSGRRRPPPSGRGAARRPRRGRPVPGSATPPALSEPTAPENRGNDPGLRLDTRLPSALATGERRSDGHDRRSRAPAGRPHPADPSRARSSPAGTRCSKSSARGGWAPSTGPSRPSRSSGRWR